MNLNEPVLSEINEVLVLIEKQVEVSFVHDGRSVDSQQNLVGVEPLGSAVVP